MIDPSGPRLGPLKQGLGFEPCGWKKTWLGGETY